MPQDVNKDYTRTSTVPVKVVWTPLASGGRKNIPVNTKYYPVSRFKQGADWQNEAWSVIINLANAELENNKTVSYAAAGFFS